MSDVQRQAVPVKWRKHTNVEEDQRLDVIEARISRKKVTLAEAMAERRKIMMTAIKRMRRAEGKR